MMDSSPMFRPLTHSDATDDEAMALLYGEDIEHAIAAAMTVFEESDPRKVGTLSRPDFRRCIKINALYSGPRRRG